MTKSGVTKQSIGVVGAGIVGLSVARRLQHSMHVEVTVIEKERTVAAQQTGHNSNVVHSGVYYPPRSLTIRLDRSQRSCVGAEGTVTHLLCGTRTPVSRGREGHHRTARR